MTPLMISTDTLQDREPTIAYRRPIPPFVTGTRSFVRFRRSLPDPFLGGVQQPTEGLMMSAPVVPTTHQPSDGVYTCLSILA